MAAATGAPADAGLGGRPARQPRRMVAALAVTQTIGYGTLYYAYAVLLEPMAAALGASTAAVTGALTASVIAGALAAVPVGRWLDRHGGRGLMTGGSLAATALLLAWSRVDTIGQLYAVMIGIGVTGAMVLYEPAFAVIVSWYAPPRRDRALLAVTIVAGFASTIFLPLTGLLVARLDWRGALLVLAAVHAATAVPLHAATVRRPPRPGRAASRKTGGRGRPARPPGAARRAVRDARFWILVSTFVAHGAATSTMTVHLVGFLTHRGHAATFAAAVAGLLGILSVTGRLVLTGARRRLSVPTVLAVIFAVQAAAALGLAVAGGTRAGAVLGVTAFGLGFGVASLAVPALLADRYGTVGYAAVAGLLAAPVTLAKATAPLAGALLLHRTGYGPLLAAVAGCCTLAAAGVLTRAAGAVAR
ncbi:MFS transporter [Micromonospora sp. C28SCA-DRY-2]|uniref:MFS transporter n=1 Tax=Micromonospora sp. C28SCA-DRY-2 TaxID=3059522 RepID=UPI002674A74A|nr:MFS transporter [Micromonospora sp. C28SCA-DRY-2]MDO3704403.1 MFS transporter [Micromonospora sp. C28SCA-DRY-2]